MENSSICSAKEATVRWDKNQEEKPEELMHPPSSLYMPGFVLHTELTLHADVAIFQASIPSKLPEQASRASIPSKQ
jgi:hypothetical protein